MRKTVVRGQRSWVSPITYYLLPITVLFSFFIFTPFVHAEEDRTYSLNLVDEDIKTVIKLLASESGKNFIIPDGISGKVTLTLDKMKLNDALDVILKSHGLGYITEKGVVRIVKLSEVEVAGEELSTEVVIINYAKALDLVNQIKNVLSPKGTVSVDPRTNSFIIRDIKGGVDEAKKLLGKLDSETPQVVIEARIVEATTDFSRDLGVQWGAGYNADASHGNPTGYYFPNSYNVVAGGGGAFALSPPSAGGVGAGASGGAVAGISFGSIGNTLNLDLRLSAMEKQGWGKVMSSPKITTIDNKEAVIQQGISIPYLTTSSAGTQTLFVDANLSLTVTPHVTSDGKLLMKIKASKNAPSMQYSVANVGIAIDKKEASTEVLVRDGDTTVIGGIYQITKGEVTSSVPFLGKIPVIGWFFKSKSMEDKKTELLIFITPRIIKKM